MTLSAVKLRRHSKLRKRRGEKESQANIMSVGDRTKFIAIDMTTIFGIHTTETLALSNRSICFEFCAAIQCSRDAVKPTMMAQQI